MSKFTIEELRELAGILGESGLGSIEISDGDYSLKMTAPVYAAAPSAESFAPRAMPTPIEHAPETLEAIPEADGKIVTSPIVGVFYSASSPESEPFVTLGSRVAVGDTLCIVEAMKLMNEINAEFEGEVVEILASNGDVVDFGKPLFRIKESV